VKAKGDPPSRISAAMLELVSRQGYETTTVSDVISLIGMSRKTFYEHFEDRRGCFMWVCERVGAQWLQQAREAIAATPEGQSQTIALLSTLFTRAIEQPGALRAVMLEPAVVRPGGPELRARAIGEWSSLLAAALQSDDPSAALLSPELAAAIFGGITRTLHVSLPAGVKPRAPRRRQLMDLIPQLAAWAACYVDHPPPARPLPHRENGTPAPLLFGGRAPGTLALSSRSNERRGLPRGENPISRSFVVHSQRERILDAVANLAAAEGYAALTIPEIVQEAAVSVQAFYEHFSGKEDAFLVAYEVGHRRALVAFERAFDSEQDWPRAIHAGLQALFGFCAAEPSFAHCALVDAPSASDRAATLLVQGMAGYMPMFEAGFAEAGADRRPPPISAEATLFALLELCFAHVARERARELADLVPEGTFIALAPFIGGEAATQIASPGEVPIANGDAKKTPASRSRRKAQAQ
jgi:AcrR family transcriptional regulator